MGTNLEEALRQRFINFNYVNNFNVYNHLLENLSLGATVDTDPTHTQSNILGDMKLAYSGQVVDDEPYLFGAPDDGLTLNLTNGMSGKPVSRTIYVISPMKFDEAVLKGSGTKNRFNQAPTLIAELQFDSPRATLPNGDPLIDFFPLPVWAVGVNFKTGDQTDQLSDQTMLIGPTCQFIETGSINFNGTDYDNEPTHVGSYDSYGSTTFTLSVSMQRTETTVNVNASLALDSVKYPFGGKIPKVPATDPNYVGVGSLTDAQNNAQKITAVGVALVNSGHSVPPSKLPTYAKVSVRLRQFRLFYD